MKEIIENYLNSRSGYEVDNENKDFVDELYDLLEPKIDRMLDNTYVDGYDAGIREANDYDEAFNDGYKAAKEEIEENK